MSLRVNVGHSSLTGPRERNEDFCGVVTPEGGELENKGVLAALADGIGGHRGGREAAEYTVRGLLSDYYATPDTWAVPTALDKVLSALNRWVMAQAARDSELSGMATTLTALVLRGQRYMTAHVGDSRLYLLRDGQLTLMTNDHLWDHPELKNVLSRAIGLDANVLLDFGDGQLLVGDRFLLVSDGVWSILSGQRLSETLLGHPDAQQAAAALTTLALALGGQDNATAVVIEVLALPPPDRRDSLEQGTRLPLPPRFRIGQEIDGLMVEEILHDSRETLLYRVRAAHTGQRMVLKTLCPEYAGDASAANALLKEEWLTRRVVSPFFAQLMPSQQRSALYFLMSWHEGASLQKMLDAGRHFSQADAIQHGINLMKGLAGLHRLNIAHRDIKPDNLHLGSDGRLRILDLGIARSLGESDSAAATDGNPGTPSYMAPDLFEGAQAGAAHDLYAAGVTLYHLLTRKYPYGEIEPFQHPRFGDPVPATRWRPEIPQWFDNLLQKAVARDPKQRFETAEEFLLALERGATRPLGRPRATPLLMRNPVLTWRIIAVCSLLLNLLLIVLLRER